MTSLYPADWAVIFGGLMAIIAGVARWVQRQSKTSEPTADAVANAVTPPGAPPGDRPETLDGGLRLLSESVSRLASQLEGTQAELAAFRQHLPTVIAWGHRGWAHAPEHRREPEPPLPHSLRLDRED